jgi:hypothetical protein
LTYPSNKTFIFQKQEIMIRNKIFLVFAAAGLVISGCNKKLDQKPQDALFDNEAIKDYQTLKAATVGIYDVLNSLNYYGQTYPSILELRGNDMYIGASNSNRLLSSFKYNYTTTDGDVTGIWNTVYNMIQRANNVINRSADVKDATADQINALKGEAYFLRALGHFDLVRVFAKPYTFDNGASLGVPVVTSFEIGNPARNTVAQVYTQVIVDLQQAVNLLPDDPFTKFRATQMAAKALLARVYLYKGDNANAATQAADVINSGEFELTSPALYGSGVFWRTPGSNEEIFTIKVSQFEDRGSDNYGQLYNPSPAYGDLRVYPQFYASYLPGDVRQNLIVDDGTGVLYTEKFKVQDNIPGMYSPKILRLAEMYFIHAEASVKLGNNQDAIDDLNAVRRQRGLPDIAAGTTLTLSDVLREKNWELAFEGHQWQDRLRNNLTTPRPSNLDATSLPNGANNVATTDYRQLFPIPQREIDANPSIRSQQNPGYQ